MKICRMIAGFPSASVIKEGADSSRYLGPNAYAISREQVRLGARVDVICKGDGAEEQIDGITVHRVKKPYNLSAFSKLSRMNAQGRIDILHVHASSAFLAARAGVLSTSARLVAHVHGTTAGSSLLFGQNRSSREIISNSLSIAREKAVWNSAKRVVAVSDNIARELVQCYHVPKNRVRIVYNGVDTSIFAPQESRETIRKERNWQEKNVFLYVGQISPRKGLSYLIEAAKIVCKERSDVLFVIVGGVPSYQESSTTTFLKQLQSTASRLLGNQIIFPGPVPNSELPKIHSASDVFVFPSLYEGLPKAVLEAMSCGKPCISTTAGGMPSLIGPEEGILVPPADSVRLAQAIQSMLSDESKMKSMGRSAREKIIRDFTWQGAARKLQEVYYEIL